MTLFRFSSRPVAAGVSLLLAAAAHAGINLQIGNNFTGATLYADSSAVPPDSDGAVGPTNFVVFVNGRFSVFDKVSATKVQTMSDATFWANAGVSLGGLSISDTRVIYDPLSQRWFASQVDFNPNDLESNRFLLAVSSSADPTGVWNGLAWPADPGGTLTDFPRLGLDANGVYLTGNQYDVSGNFVLGVLLTSIPKADLLLPTPTAANRTTTGVMPVAARGFSLQPAVNFNATNSAEFVLATENDGADFLTHTNLLGFTVQNADTASASFPASSDIVVPGYFVPLNPPQPDGQSTLDDGDVRIGSYAMQVGDDVYATHAVESGTRAVIRWYRVGASDHLLRESGTISDPSLDLFYPSLAVNTNGFLVIGFNGCSTNTFISAYAVAGRTVDGLTVFGDKVLLQAGAANYEVAPQGDNRWGDYSTTTVDAANPSHFWTAQEYPSSANVWSVAVTEMIVTETPPVLNLAAAGGQVQLSWPTNEAGFSLQSATNLSAPVAWSAVTNAVAIVGTNHTVTVSSRAALNYFRLAW